MLDLPERGGGAATESRAKERRRQPRLTELLLDMSNRIAQAEDLGDALRKVRDFCTNAIGAERGSVFLNDPATNELYSRVTGKFAREIRILNTSGVAGYCFTHGEGVIIHDAYADSRFNSTIDQQTGYKTRSILCAPLRTLKGETIGVAQLLNKVEGDFTKEDLFLLESAIAQAAVSLESLRTIENIEKRRKQELEFLAVVSEISSELKLGPMLQKTIAAITRMLDAERSTLFVNDEKTNELYTEIGQGLGASTLRLPNHLGIAGAVFTSGQSVNIPYAYADLRFNPSFDRKTGYFTRSILCVPVTNKEGKVIGVTQVLNKRGGTFSQEDEARLKAFTSQISIGLENAKLFDDVQQMKNYNESVLESMTNGVITTNAEGQIVTCNAASGRILKMRIKEAIGKSASEFFTGANGWVLEKLDAVKETGEVQTAMDADMQGILDPVPLNANVTVMPLKGENKVLGSMVMIEDISAEKRMKSTMSRYLDPALADKMMAEGGLDGKQVEATVLFSDIRSFTTLSEELGAQGIVSLLNEYFTVMVDCLNVEGGILDKFIGDAIMALFGAVEARADEEDHAVKAAIAMLRELHVFNSRRVADGKRPVDIGVGLNTDMIISGNIGHPKRMNFTVIGDGVNLASRLEGACKEYGAHIMVSENTVRKLKGTYRMREMDWIVVKGKTQPVGVYEVLDYHTDDSFPNMMGVVQAFGYGLKEYRKGAFEQAKKAFEEARGLNPADKGSKIFLERCELLMAAPPADWDGVWKMDHK